MVRTTFLLSALLLTGSTVLADHGFESSYEAAVAKADSQNLPLLIHFHASYCGPCRMMTAQVFSQPSIQNQLQSGLVAVEIDVQQRPDLAQKYGTTTVPRDVVVYQGQAPQTINKGFKSTLAFSSILQQIASRGAASATKVNRIQQKARTAVLVANTKPEPILGLEGFCPVKLIRDREWVSGKPELTETYRDIVYHFSSEEAAKEFHDAPRRFSPQNLGCDPIVLFENQQAIVGDIKFGAFFDNQLFLFDTDKNRREFKQNPLRYRRYQHALKVDDLAVRKIQ
ncbi:MAG: thioredoxin family protein [Fuerstiella sp.]